LRGDAHKIPANQAVSALLCDVLRFDQINGRGGFRTCDLSRVKNPAKAAQMARIACI
jgi:hypothetical protein